MLAAAELLADARVDLLLWNGKAASWLGFERDRQVVAALEQHTGVAATTALIAINAALAGIDARRIALVTPYVAAIETKIVQTYARGVHEPGRLGGGRITHARTRHAGLGFSPRGHRAES